MQQLKEPYQESINVLTEHISNLRNANRYNDFATFFDDCLYQSGGIDLPKRCKPFFTASYNPGGKCFITMKNEKGHTITLHIEPREIKEACKRIYSEKKTKQLSIF